MTTPAPPPHVLDTVATGRCADAEAAGGSGQEAIQVSGPKTS
ncbi:hypothetical protein [Nocardioides malaquae]|nr:hypothetical protein [Nocardioides malaquae]